MACVDYFECLAESLEQISQRMPTEKAFSLFRSVAKPLVLFVAALYLLGFMVFPWLQVGNYQLVVVDALLPSEWAMLLVLIGVLFAWSFHCVFKLAKELLNSGRD
jgi:hypothetical protein